MNDYEYHAANVKAALVAALIEDLPLDDMADRQAYAKALGARSEGPTREFVKACERVRILRETQERLRAL